MKKVLVAGFLILIVANVSYAQNKFTPTLIVTYPLQISASDSLLKEVEDYTRETVITDEIRNNYVPENLAENWKIIRSKELEFLQKQNYFSQLPFGITTNLTYKIFDYHETPLVFPVNDVCQDTHTSVQAIAKKYKVDWVVNPVKVEIKHTEKGNTMVAHIKLYNVVTNRFFLDEIYTSNTENLTGALECEQGSWQCAVNSIIAQSIVDIFDRLEKNRRYWTYNE